MKHSYHLDSLRGLLSFIVVLQHAATAFIYSINGTSSIINTYLGLAAHYSVIFFFVLSGYVITLSISENIKRNGYFVATEYVISRSVRILPPLLGAIFLTIVLSTILSNYNSSQVIGNYAYFIRKEYYPDIVNQFKALLSLMIYGDLTGGVSNVNGALWSLVYEIQFYVIAGLISVIVAGSNNIYKAVCLVLVVAYAGNINLSLSFNMQWISFICFALGSASFFLTGYLSRSIFALPLAFILMITCVFYHTGINDIATQLRGSILRGGTWMIYMAVMGGVFAILIAKINSFGRFISIFHSISPFSYSLYITHFPIIAFLWFAIANNLTRILPHYYLLTLMSSLLCIIFALLFSKVLEKPRAHRAFIYKSLRLKIK